MGLKRNFYLLRVQVGRITRQVRGQIDALLLVVEATTGRSRFTEEVRTPRRNPASMRACRTS